MAVPPVPASAVALTGTGTEKVSEVNVVIVKDLPLRTVANVPESPLIRTVDLSANPCAVAVITQEPDNAAWFAAVTVFVGLVAL